MHLTCLFGYCCFVFVFVLFIIIYLFIHVIFRVILCVLTLPERCRYCYLY